MEEPWRAPGRVRSTHATTTKDDYGSRTPQPPREQNNVRTGAGEHTLL